MCFFHVEDDFTSDYIVLGNVISTLIFYTDGLIQHFCPLSIIVFVLFFNVNCDKFVVAIQSNEH